MSWLDESFGYFLDAINKYFVFEGRARRKEFWYFWLYLAILYIPFMFLDQFLSNKYGIHSVFSLLFTLATFIPFASVTVRRLHDIGRSGWWWFLNLIPLIGLIILMIWQTYASQPGVNKYGPNPCDAPRSNA